ncbi:MAG: hypothetical protein L0H83_12470, partial [Salinisphaera sp.]|nr:hypothetical protein [Salinisphaera sp.]
FRFPDGAASFCRVAASSNWREDQWGGDLAQRARFLFAILSGVRAALPADKILAINLNSTEPRTRDA